MAMIDRTVEKEKEDEMEVVEVEVYIRGGGDQDPGRSLSSVTAILNLTMCLRNPSLDV